MRFQTLAILLVSLFASSTMATDYLCCQKGCTVCSGGPVRP